MHELSLCLRVVKRAEAALAGETCARVLAVRLEVGALAAVDAAALRFAFAAASHGTCCEGARLDIVEPPGTACCEDCGAAVRIARLGEACGACGGYRLRITGGTELRLQALEVE